MKLTEPLGVPRRQVPLVFARHLRIDYPVPFDHRQIGILVARRGVERPHVVRVRQAVVLVEAMLQRQKLRMVAQVPFTEHGGGVPLASANLRKRDFVAVDAVLGGRTQRQKYRCAGDNNR